MDKDTRPEDDTTCSRDAASRDDRLLRLIVALLAVVGALCVLPIAFSIVALVLKLALGALGLLIGLVCGLLGLAIGLLSAAVSLLVGLAGALAGFLLSPPGLVLLAILLWYQLEEH